MRVSAHKPTIRFGTKEAEVACGEWRFNCGPGALCAILNLTPDEIRPKLLDFEKKGYSNPTLMTNILKQFEGVKFYQTYRCDEPKGLPHVSWGLMRLQWGGPWTKKGVPMRVRYRHTHWVAVSGDYIFDVNAVFCDQFSCVGWIESSEWVFSLMPWLREGCEPEGDGTFWPTHAIEVIVPPK